ncbi:MAG: hypothetical protein AUH92_00900 [Acidobacteria bacterium 13_1_40CM_4_69_4]|nr:MAG: hypothetical protein AUH92_00900 [Acidobacteria bacterium 13_1_40CM_4_69_4]
MIAALRGCAEALFFCVERAVTAALYPWCLLRRRLGAGVRVPILMYHQIGRPLKGAPSCRDSVSPQRFERQIRAILEAGYRVIPLSTLIRDMQAGSSPARGRAVVLTFDDGFRGQFTYAYPVLRRYRLPATFFVVAGYLGREVLFRHLSVTGRPARGGPLPPDWLPLSWDEVGEMVRHGVAIGSHSLSHRSLGVLSGAEAEIEVRGSKEALEARLGVPVELFAYPFGSRAYGDFHRDLDELLRRSGYRAACTTVIGRSGHGADLYALPRIPIEESDGPFRVRCKLLGAYDWVGPVKSLWQRLLARQERVDAALPSGAECEPH